MFEGLDTSRPAIARARLDAFARLTRLQALRLALDRAGYGVPVPTSYAELLQFDLSALVARARRLAGWQQKAETPADTAR